MALTSQVEAKEYVDTIFKHFMHKLSEWEDGFVRSCRTRIDEGIPLTPAQLLKLDQIMERVSAQHGRF